MNEWFVVVIICLVFFHFASIRKRKSKEKTIASKQSVKVVKLKCISSNKVQLTDLCHSHDSHCLLSCSQEKNNTRNNRQQKHDK